MTPIPGNNGGLPAAIAGLLLGLAIALSPAGSSGAPSSAGGSGAEPPSLPAAAPAAAQTAPAAAPAATPIVLAADFAATGEDRVFADFPLRPESGGESAALLLRDLSLENPAAIRAATLHLRSGDGWWSAELPPSALSGTRRIPFAAFAAEGAPGAPAESDLLRVSLWRAARPGAARFAAADAVFAPPAAVVVIRATEATAPGESGFAARMAARLERILARAGIPFDTFPDTELETLLPPPPQAPPSTPMAVLAALNPLGAQADNAQPDTPRAVPDAILLPYSPALDSARLDALERFTRSGGFIVAFYNASPGLARILGLPETRWAGAVEGRWAAIDWNGRRIPHPTTNIIAPADDIRPPATVVASWASVSGNTTDAPAIVATPAGALFAHVPPLAFPAAQGLLASLLEGHGAGEPAPAPAATADAIPRFPVVAAWVPSSRIQGSIPDDITTLYAYAAGDGHTPLLRHAAGDPAEGVPAVHVWLPLLCAADRDGAWLDPSAPGTRETVLGRVRAVARRHPAGIHFDYLRTDDAAPASEKTAAAISDLVRRASVAVRTIDPAIVLSAAVYPTPSAAILRNQDWPAWLRDGLLDYAVPMIYDDSPASFRASLAECLAAAPAERIVAGIGTGADEAQVDDAAFRAQLAAAAEANLRGVAFFPLDDALRGLLP